MRPIAITIESGNCFINQVVIIHAIQLGVVGHDSVRIQFLLVELADK
jgi:hypothetical protein